jgi:hypothetical protein
MTDPTPEALAAARAAVKHCLELSNTDEHIFTDAPGDGLACQHCVALALTEQAREIEQATWEAAAKFVGANRCRDSFRMAISCGHPPCDYSKAVADAFRARAAAQGGRT